MIRFVKQLLSIAAIFLNCLPAISVAAVPDSRFADVNGQILAECESGGPPSIP